MQRIEVHHLTEGKITIFNSPSEASKKLKMKRDIIIRCLRGKQKTYKNHIFKTL
jgi:hypothetical protein